MDWINRLYDALVNRVPGIHQRYELWRNTHDGSGRFLGWFYLLWMNFRYHVMRQRSLAEPLLDCSTDDRIRLTPQPESECAFSIGCDALADRLSQADVVSFDVFDTLLLRPFQEPTDLFFELAYRLRYPGLKQLRVEAETSCRRMKGVGAEVTLEEIWTELERTSGIPAEEGMAAEWQTELDCCRANPYFLPVIRQLKERGTEMILCSDMYLDSEKLLQLLSRCGFDGFRHCFVSCEYGISKSTGGLFDRVKETCGAQRRYIHIGDNPVSDVKMARNKGFEAIHYPNVNTVGRKSRCTDLSPLTASAYAGIVNGHIYNGSGRYGSDYELGFIYGGLFVTGFCQYIHDYAQREQLDRLLFLARDGEILERAYRLMYPQEADRCAYVLWSRQAAVRLGAGRFRSQFERYMLRYKTDAGYTLEQVMESMLLSDMLLGFLEENSPSRRGDVLSGQLADRLWSYLQKHWDEVLEHYRQELLEGGRYYAEALKGARRAAAIDVGWVGSGPLTLRWLIEEEWKLDCRVSCILAGTVGQCGQDRQNSEAELAKGTMVSYLFSSAHNRDIWSVHDAGLGHNMLVELLLCATTPSFCGFIRQDGDGYTFSSHKEQIDSKAVQTGILDFVKMYADHPWSQVRISGRDAMAPIRVLYRNPKWIRDLIERTRINANIE